MHQRAPLSRIRKIHGQYYTKAAIGKLLVNCLRQEVIHTALELGAGQGALIRAARGRWPLAKFVSVDIDPQNAPIAPAELRTHYVFDVLRKDLPRRIGLQENSVDLALCNPPFAPPKWERRYQHILSRAGLPIAGATSFGADAFFIAQNLWMLRDRGELGIIVPAGLIAGSRSQPIREVLLAQHEVHQVVELPVGAFSNTEVRTYLLCLQKGRGTQFPIRLRRLGTHGIERDEIEISTNLAAQRMDFSHYDRELICEASSNFKNEIEVNRGTIENAAARDRGIDVLHTSDIGFREIRWLATKVVALPHCVTAVKGDLLMARVGRDFFTKLGILESPVATITDCVFSIRSDRHSPDALLRAFSSETGQRWLASRARGACARYITKEDLQMFPVSEILS